MANCPNKSIPNAATRQREASPDVLKGSRLVRVSAPTNREERNDRGKDRGEDRRWWRSREQSGGMEPLSKVNEQKDNVLAPNPTLSPSHGLAGGITGGVRVVEYTSVALLFLFGAKMGLTARSLTTQRPKEGCFRMVASNVSVRYSVQACEILLDP